MTDLPDRILAAIAQTAKNATLSCNDVHPEADTNCLGGHRDLKVLDRCEADKRTVERHWPPLNAAGQIAGCLACGRLWPCPDLLDRADAYGVATTEETPREH